MEPGAEAAAKLGSMTRVYLDLVGDGFDARHGDLLRRARALGTELVVGVHSDGDCEWFHRRPSMALDARVRAVAASGLADRVVAAPPVFLDRDWLQSRSIDLVAHSDRLPERSRRYWYRVPIEMGIFRTVSGEAADGCIDLEGRLVTSASAPVRESSRLGRRVRRRMKRWLPQVDLDLQRREFVASLHRLADVLHATPIGERTWVVGGLLLGWAREGGPLDSDLGDADFAYLEQDHERFLASVSALAAAGFAPSHRFSSADGRYVEHRFRRGAVQFDFFRMAPVADRWRYSLFTGGKEPEELVAEVPAQPHVPFTFLDREWRKVVDHDLALRSIYGDWRTDHPDWSFISDRAVVEHIPMAHLPHAWSWPGAIAQGPGERQDRS